MTMILLFIVKILFLTSYYICMCRFFSRKAKSPDAKSKTPEPQIRADISDKSTRTLGNKSAKAPQIRVSTVSIATSTNSIFKYKF